MPLGTPFGDLYHGLKHRFSAGALGALLVLATMPQAAATAPGLAGIHENYAISLYGVEAGLPSNSAPTVVQTRDGYIWVGTEIGLARFDGVRFVTFRTANTPELPANLIRALVEDREGWLWIGTNSGVCRYKGGKFERIGFDGTTSLTGTVNAIVEDRSGSVWLATNNNGLWEYKGGRLISHRTDPGMPTSLRIGPLATDAAGQLVFGMDGVLHRFEGPNVRPLQGVGGLAGVTRFVEQVRGTFWIANGDGLHRVRNGEVKRFGPDDGIRLDTFHLFLDKTSRLWACGNGLYLLPTPESERFVRVNVPGIENTRSVVEDSEGSLWVTSAGDGIARLRASGFRMQTPEDGLLGSNTRTVIVDPAGVVWAGMPATGVARIEPDGATTTIETGRSLEGEVWALCAEPDGAVWIGTRGVLRRWRDGVQQEFPQFRRIRALFRDSAGAIWIGSENEGVTRYRDGKFESMVATIQARQTGSLRTVRPIAMAFAEKADGTLYIGLRDATGLVTMQGAEVSVSHGPMLTEIRAIYPDPEGNLWVGTKGRGLAVLHNGEWLNPEGLAGPFGDQVSALVGDDEGRLWIGTPQGIMWAPKAQLLAVARGEPFIPNLRLAQAGDGVRPGVVGSGSFPNSAQTGEGILYFGTRGGLTVVDTHAISLNKAVPPVHVERVLVDNKAAALNDPIRLPAGSRSLEIEYTAPSFVGPSQVRFRFQLVGRDAEWVEAGTRRVALYADLRPGVYTFRVTACNDDGIWNETGARIAIIQAPFFYETAWFYGVVAVGLMGTGLGVYRWRTAQLHRRNEALEKGIAERTAELATSYEALKKAQRDLLEASRLAGIAEMATGILHNLGNALNSVNTTTSLATARIRGSKISSVQTLARLLDEHKDDLPDFLRNDPRGQKVPEYLARLAEHLANERDEILGELDALQGNVDQIKEMVAAQQSHARVTGLIENIPAPELVDLALRIDEPSLVRHGVAVRRDFKGCPLVRVERQKVLQILGNLVKNAKDSVDATGRTDKEICVTVDVDAVDRVRISVTDNGQGIAPENLTKIFLFGFTTKRQGHGFGLHSGALAAKELGGSLSAKSEGVGKGATFVLELPRAG